MTQTLSVFLPNTILYVSGTVNGVSTTWTLSGENTWETIVNRAEDDTYYVSMEIVSGSGQTTVTQFVLYYGLLNLITDRTQADVDLAIRLNSLGWDSMSQSEREIYLAGLKGSYNTADLNRVGNAINYVAGRLNNAGYNISVLPKINWVIGDIPSESEMTAYLNDVSVIRNTLPAPESMPNVPDDMNNLTWQDANNIEQILLDVDFLITNMNAAWYYSGEIYCGEV